MAHDCKVDYRSFRQGTPEPARRHQVVLPPLRPGASKPAETPPADGTMAHRRADDVPVGG